MPSLRALDPFALAAAAGAAGLVVLYVSVVYGQGNEPALWVVVVLGAGAVLAAYGSVRRLPYRQVALAAAALLLGLLGLVAILSIGLLILIAAALAGVALLRSIVGSARPVPRGGGPVDMSP